MGVQNVSKRNQFSRIFRYSTSAIISMQWFLFYWSLTLLRTVNRTYFRRRNGRCRCISSFEIQRRDLITGSPEVHVCWMKLPFSTIVLAKRTLKSQWHWLLLCNRWWKNIGHCRDSNPWALGIAFLHSTTELSNHTPICHRIYHQIPEPGRIYPLQIWIQSQILETEKHCEMLSKCRSSGHS